VLENEAINQEDVEAAFHDFEAVWNKLSPRQQSQIVGLLISSVEFDPEESSIELEFHPTGIKELSEQTGAVA
jgi:site-specific DNA recombinase